MQEYKVDMTNKAERRAYRRSVILLMQKAICNIWNKLVRVRVLHSLGEGYYCELEDMEIDNGMLLRLKEEMIRLAEKDLPIVKMTVKIMSAQDHVKYLP